MQTAAARWNALTPEGRMPFKALAAADKIRYASELAIERAQTAATIAATHGEADETPVETEREDELPKEPPVAVRPIAKAIVMMSESESNSGSESE